MGNHEAVFGNVCPYHLVPSYDLTVILALHLNLLELLLKLYLLLLLRREALSLVTATGGLRSYEYLGLVWLPHQTAVLALLKLIRITILPGKKSTLCLAFASFIDCPIFRSWALTLREMHNAFESI